MSRTGHKDRSLTDSSLRQSYLLSDRRLDNVLNGLATAQAALTRKGDPPNYSPDAYDIADAWNAIYNLERLLPPIEGWCCGYSFGSGGYSVFSAHEHKADAELWLPYWRNHPDLSHRKDIWEVTRRESEIGDWVKPGGPPAP